MTTTVKERQRSATEGLRRGVDRSLPWTYTTRRDYRQLAVQRPRRPPGPMWQYHKGNITRLTATLPRLSATLLIPRQGTSGIKSCRANPAKPHKVRLRI